MANRTCLDCGAITTATRCDRCRSGQQRARDQSRGTRQQRGYDASYDAAHAAWQQRLDQSEQVTCWRCAEQGRPHLVDPRPGHWHLGHDLVDRSIVRGPQCPESNLHDAGALRA